MKFENGLFTGACLVFATIMLSWLIDGQPDELDQEQALYCEMVTTHKATGGEYGWPDYKGAYQEYCK